MPSSVKHGDEGIDGGHLGIGRVIPKCFELRNFRSNATSFTVAFYLR